MPSSGETPCSWLQPRVVGSEQRPVRLALATMARKDYIVALEFLDMTPATTAAIRQIVTINERHARQRLPNRARAGARAVIARLKFQVKAVLHDSRRLRGRS